jgi:hypothetical protein
MSLAYEAQHRPIRRNPRRLHTLRRGAPRSGRADIWFSHKISRLDCHAAKTVSCSAQAIGSVSSAWG